MQRADPEEASAVLDELEPAGEVEVPKARSRLWAIAGVATIAGLIALAGVTQRNDIYDAGHLLRDSNPWWIAVAVLFTLVALQSLNGTYVYALRAAGVDVTYLRLLPTTLRGHLLNLVAKSNGLAGLVSFTRYGKERGETRGPYVAGYLLSGISQQVGFAIVAFAAFVLMLVQGDLKITDMIAGIVFVIYVGANVLLITSALRSRTAIRSIYQRIHRVIPSRRNSPPDHTSADELHEAAQLLRSKPGIALLTLLPATCIDFAYVGLLYAVLQAVGAPTSVSVVFVAFSLSTLFGIIGFLPSGIGFVEVSALAVLIDSGVPPARAGAAIALFRLGQLWVPILAGVAVTGSRLPSQWWRVIRWVSASAAAIMALIGLIASAGQSSGRRLNVSETVTGIVQSAHFGAALTAIAIASCVPGLWRGKRWASIAVVPLGAILFATTGPYRPDIALSMGIIVSLVVLGHGAFGVQSDVFAFTANLRRYAAAQIGIFIYGLGGLSFMDRSFGDVPIIDALRNSMKLLFLLPADADALTVRGVYLIESVRLLSLVASGVFVFSVLVPLVRKPRGAVRDREQEQAAVVVNRWGANRLAHFTLWNDKEWVLADEGVIAYHLAHNVALALGGPIGSPEGQSEALGNYIDHCDSVGLRPAFHQVSESDRSLLEGSGFRLLHVGAEAIVDTGTFSLEGSHWKSIRNTLRKLESTGYRAEELPQPLTDETVSELEQVSDAWRSSGGHRERTFTLGQFSPEYVRSTRVLAVLGPDDSVHAFVNIVPPYRDRNGTFDMMRRRPDSANGVMDLLFVSMIEMFKAEGLAGMNIGMAPLAMLPDDDLLDQGLQQLRARGDHWFNFAGLEKYKEKWEPRWEPRYVAYRSNADLPAVLRAVQTAGEIPDDIDVTERWWSNVKRFPASAAMGALILYLMIATAIDPNLHTRLVTGFGVSFRSVGNIEWWRFISSPLIQAGAGFVWGNLFLVLSVMPLAEFLYGSRRMIQSFWLGHILTIAPVIFLLRLFGELGDTTSLELAYTRDAGSSAGLWALVGYAIYRIPDRRWRFGAVAFGVVGHLILWGASGELADVQHAIATAIGVGMGAVWARLDQRPTQPTIGRVPLPPK